MKMAIVVATFLVFAPCIASSEEADGPMPLGKAAKKGVVRVSASARTGFSGMTMSIANDNSEEITVDVFGAMFYPPSSGTQPLGVPRVNMTSSTSLVSIPAKQTWKGDCPSFCLDGHAGGPSSGTKYVLAEALVPSKIQEVFSYWNEHPSISQSRVQSAVWSNSVASLTGVRTTTVPLSPAPSVPQSPYELPQRPWLVVLKGIDYILWLDGIVTTGQAGSIGGADDKIGENFYALYLCGNDLYGLKKRNDASGYRLYLRDGRQWKDIDSIYTLPDESGIFPGGRPVFRKDGMVFTPGHEQRSLINAEVQSLSSGVIRGVIATTFLTKSGHVLSIDPNTGIANYVPDRSWYEFFGVGDELMAAHTGSRLTWQRTGQGSSYKNFPAKIDRVLISGKRMAVFCDGRVWFLSANDVWIKGRLLQADMAGACLDETTGDLHILSSQAELTILRASQSGGASR